MNIGGLDVEYNQLLEFNLCIIISRALLLCFMCRAGNGFVLSDPTLLLSVIRANLWVLFFLHRAEIIKQRLLAYQSIVVRECCLDPLYNVHKPICGANQYCETYMVYQIKNLPSSKEAPAASSTRYLRSLSSRPQGTFGNDTQHSLKSAGPAHSCEAFAPSKNLFSVHSYGGTNSTNISGFRSGFP